MRECTDLMPRATIVQLVGVRNRALAQATQLFEDVKRVNDLAKAVNPVRSWSAPTLSFDRGHHREGADPDGYRKTLDAAAWEYVMERTGLRDLMGHKQKEEWRDRLRNDPPEFTIENVVATFEGMAGQADRIFLQSIVDVFERLPRDFRSHDGFKIGARCVMTYAVSTWAGFSWTYRSHNNSRDQLADLDRAFHKLAGKPWTVRADDIAADAMKKGETECETPFFRLRWFKNGNLHVWMKDRKVVDDANRLLGLHYGARLGWMHKHPDDRRGAA